MEKKEKGQFKNRKFALCKTDHNMRIQMYS